VIEMLAIDIRNHRHDGREFQKRSVALIRFDDHEIATAKARI